MNAEQKLDAARVRIAKTYCMERLDQLLLQAKGSVYTVRDIHELIGQREHWHLSRTKRLVNEAAKDGRLQKLKERRVVWVPQTGSMRGPAPATQYLVV